MDYPVKFGTQLKQQLRSLRKARGLNQTELGQRIGVTQTRIAEIEANPGVVGIEQIIKILSALGTELVVRDLEVSPSGAALQDEASRRPKKAPNTELRPAHEFRVALVPSARHLVGALEGNPSRAPEALLWRTEEHGVESKLTPKDRQGLIAALAKVLLVNPRVLEAHLESAAQAEPLPMAADVPTFEIHDQWAKALSVSREALRHAVLAMIADRVAPLGLGQPASKGAW